jgi:predicted DNA-binding transcriptional regulator AlpA
MTKFVDLINDGELAEKLSLSRGWVRKQRWLRRHGQPHVLILEPVMLGTTPRYRRSDVEAWLESLEPANDNVPSGFEGS